MDRALFGTAIAFPASLYCFTDLILHNRFLQAPQQGLCFVEEKAQILGTKLVRRTAKSTDIAPLGFSIDKRRLDKNAYIHGGSRLVQKSYPTTTTTKFCPLPGIAYGPSERTKLDVFPAPGEGNPVLLYFHGGYWQRGSREDYSFLAEPFVAAGVTVVMAGYDLCPDVTMTELVAQTRAAAAYTWRYVQEWGGDRTKMTVMGHSAGGHITGMLIATDWSQVDTDMPRAIFRAAIPVSPLNDLAPLRPTTLNKALKITDAEVDELSPQDLPPIDDAPQLVVVGARETEEFHRQADNYVAAYRTPARVMERLSVRDCDHFDLMDELADPQSEFFLRSLSFITATEGA